MASPGSLLGALGSFLGPLEVVLGRSWRLLGRSWAILGRSLGILRRSWVALGSSWFAPGGSWLDPGRSWTAKRARRAAGQGAIVTRGKPSHRAPVGNAIFGPPPLASTLDPRWPREEENGTMELKNRRMQGREGRKRYMVESVEGGEGCHARSRAQGAGGYVYFSCFDIKHSVLKLFVFCMFTPGFSLKAALVPHRQCGGCKIFLCHLLPPSSSFVSSYDIVQMQYS